MLRISIVPKREDSNSSTVLILKVFLSSFSSPLLLTGRHFDKNNFTSDQMKFPSAQFELYVKVVVGMLHFALRNDYVCQFHALFISLDVLPGDSKAIGIICTLLNHSYPELYSPEKKKN